MTCWFVVFCCFLLFVVVLCRSVSFCVVFLSFWGVCLYMIVFAFKSKIDTCRRRHSFLYLSYACYMWYVCVEYACGGQHIEASCTRYTLNVLCYMSRPWALWAPMGYTCIRSIFMLCLCSVCVRMSAESRLGRPPSTSVPFYSCILYTYIMLCTSFLLLLYIYMYMYIVTCAELAEHWFWFSPLFRIDLLRTMPFSL